MNRPASPLYGWRRLLLGWLLLAMVWQPLLLALSQAHGFAAEPGAPVEQAQAEGHAESHSHGHGQVGSDAESGWHIFLHVLHCCAPGALLLGDRCWSLALPCCAGPPWMQVVAILPGWNAEPLRPPIG